MSNPSEKEYLRQISQNLQYSDRVIQGIGDDAAVVKQLQHQLVIAQDLFIENVHFRRRWCSAKQAAYRALATNISDFSAMVARPRYASVGLAIAENQHDWVNEFYLELKRLCLEFEIDLIGGDTSISNEIFVDICLIGEAANPIYQFGAEPGDWIAITGQLGIAAVGLFLAENELGPAPLIDQFLTPPIHLEKMEQLQQQFTITAATDVSDGLQQEIDRLQEKSSCLFHIENDLIPLDSDALQIATQYQIDLLQNVFQQGEDYQILMTISGERPYHPDLTVIGQVLHSNSLPDEHTS